MTNRRLPPVLSATTRPLLAAVAFIGLTQAAVSVALTLGIAKAFEWVASPAEHTYHFSWVLGGALVLGLTGFAIRYAERVLSERFGQEYVHSVRMKLWDHLQTLPANSIAGQRKGATVLRFIGDLSALKNWVSKGLVGASIATLSIVGGLIALFVLDWQLGAVAMGALGTTLVFQIYWNHRILDRVKALRKERSLLATDIVERIQSLAVVQSSNQTRREGSRIRRRSRRVVDASVHTAKASGVLGGSGEFASIALMTVILLVGAVQVRAGALAPAALVAALVLSRYLGPPLRRLTRVQEQWLRGTVSRNKLERFLALEGLLEPAKPAALKRGGGRLRLRNLKMDCVEGLLSATAKAGARIQLAGKNGVGKSTLLRIIAGLETPAQGMVSLDGRDLSRCSLATVRSAICLVSPDLPLMRGSLRRNLTYGNSKATDQEIAAAISAASLETYVIGLKRGLQTWVDDGGVNLSSGERFRVRLARALLATPRVLLLDEADATLDATGRRALRRVIREFEGTVIFVWRGKGTPRQDLRWELRNDGLRSVRPTTSTKNHEDSNRTSQQRGTITVLEQHRTESNRADSNELGTSSTRNTIPSRGQS